MKKQYALVLVSVPSKEVGKDIADQLINKQLAACVSLLPEISSIYTWKGETKHEQEALLVIKTRMDLFEKQVLPAIQAVHPYEIPEILAIPIAAGLPDYLNWMDSAMLPPNWGGKVRNL